MNLNNEIRQIKNDSFPQLAWVYVRGIYVPDYEVLKNKHLAGINLDHTKRIFAGERLTFAMGFANIMIAQSLSSHYYYNQRKGIIAHELSHLLIQSSSEKQVDDEAIRRGYAKEINCADRLKERLGLNRKFAGSYGSYELASLV